jgi:hypothetical protein
MPEELAVKSGGAHAHATDLGNKRTADGAGTRLKDQFNLIPLPYRGTRVQPYDGPMTEDGIVEYFLGRETYRRTEYVVLRAGSAGDAVIAVGVLDREPLFAHN